MSEAHEFWHSLSQDRRDALDESARRSILELGRYPYWDIRLCQELLEWSRLETDVSIAYTTWLERLEQRALRQGREWNRTEFLRQARLREVGE